MYKAFSTVLPQSERSEYICCYSCTIPYPTMYFGVFGIHFGGPQVDGAYPELHLSPSEGWDHARRQTGGTIRTTGDKEKLNVTPHWFRSVLPPNMGFVSKLTTNTFLGLFGFQNCG